MAKAKKKFPKQIFVGKEADREGDEWLNAQETPTGMEVQDDEREVAIYQLVRVVKLVNKTEVV